MTRSIKNIGVSILLLSLTGMLACRKDKPDPCCYFRECEEFSDMPITWFESDRFQYRTPYFNPNNENEFVYNYLDFQLKEFKLMKFNLLTKEKTELVNDVKIISQPKWSRKGWVAFDNVYGPDGYQLFIVKDNGDSLTQFSTNFANLYPAWDATGDYLSWQHSPVLGYPYYFLKQGLYSSEIDTIMRDGDENYGYTSYNDISINDILISKVYINERAHIGVSNLSNISFKSVLNMDEEGVIAIHGLTISNSSNAYFTGSNNSDDGGLFRLDVSTGNNVRLMKFCKKRYSHISISPNGKKLIVERIERYPRKNTSGQPTGAIVENSSIYMIDMQTMIETKINLE